MGTCSFCGKNAGLFRREHSECRQRHDDAIARTPALFTRVLGDQVEPEVFRGLIRDLAASAHISEDEFHTLARRGFAEMTDAALDEGVLTQANESRIKHLASAFGVRADEFADDAGQRLIMAAILRDLAAGKFVERVKLDGVLPINFEKGERIVWLFQGVRYYTTHTETEYVGSSVGVSVRLMKGVSVRSGSYRGHSIKTDSLSLESVGKLAIGTSNVYFMSEKALKTQKAFKVPLKKIIGITAHADAVTILHDGASARPMIFTVDNPIFMTEAIPLLTQL
jgi:hypothetical protein